MATYQGGDISIAPFLQGVGNFLIAKQQEAEQELKAERDRADKLFAEMQATATKINPAGALSSDQPIIMKYYDEDIKGNIIRANIARQKGDNKSYLEHIAKANEATIKVTQLIGDSKAKAKAASDFFSKFKPEEWEEGVVEEFNKWLSKPVTESGGIDAIMTNPKFQRRIDDSKVGADIDKMFNDLFKNYGKFKEVKKLSTTTAGGRPMDKVADIVEINKDLFYEGLLNMFSTPKGKAYYTRMGYGASPEEAALNLTAQYEQGGRFSRQDSRRDVRYDAPRQVSHSEGLATQRQRMVQGIINGEATYINQLIGAISAGTSFGGNQPKVEHDGKTIKIYKPLSTDGNKINWKLEASINLDDPIEKIATHLNSLINKATGENVSINALLTEGGKPRGPEVEFEKGTKKGILD